MRPGVALPADTSMMAGILLGSILSGLTAAAAALLAGATLPMAFLCYVLGGILGVCVLSLPYAICAGGDD